MSIHNILDTADRFRQLARQERPPSPQIIQPTKAVRHPQGAISDMYQFQVQQQAGTAGGVYICYKQAAFGQFVPPEYEVLNLYESYNLGDDCALAAGDTMSCWQDTDDTGVKRWVGIPNTPSVRLLQTTAAPTSSPGIACNMIAADGVTEITSGLGSGVTALSKSCGPSDPSATPLNDVTPMMKNNSIVFAVNYSRIWYIITVFQQKETRICEPPS